MLGARGRFMEIRSQSQEQPMALSEAVLSGPGAGRTVTHGGGTSSELKLAGEQSGGDWAVVEWRGGAGGETPVPNPTPRGEGPFFLQGAVTSHLRGPKNGGATRAQPALPQERPPGP